MYQKQLDLVEHDLVSLAEAMPADKYDFRPAAGAFEGVRTFGEQVRHAATMIYMTAAIVLEERSPYGPAPATTGRTPSRGRRRSWTISRPRSPTPGRRWRHSTRRTSWISLRTYFGSQPRVAVAAGIAFHSYDHYGQMVVYARMNGITPPSSHPTTSSARPSARP